LSAKYFVRNVVPNVMITRDIIKDGDRSAVEIPVAAFDY